ncbi:MAG: SIS domain-containing protein [Thermoplasmata archaeon]|nr:SIS domain-containing protein [Thermoplasmata archaeon]
MCGIFGIVFSQNRRELGDILIGAGRRLTYRGYDSVGVATLQEGLDRTDLKKDAGTIDNAARNKIDLRKDVGTIDDVAQKYNIRKMSGIRGIVQLRWATFGAPVRVNAQPHIDCTGNLVGAHNGNIVNTVKLREYFKNGQHDVKGWNDGEMVVHSIEEKIRNDYSVENVRKAISESDRLLRGDYAFVFTHNRENIMYAARKGSSLYLGVGGGFVCTSSDLPSILPLTKNIVYLNDGEFVEYNDREYKIFDIATGIEILREPELSEVDINCVEKGEYPHYMLKEIHEQPKTVHNMLALLEESVYVGRFLDVLHQADHIFFVASGSSFNAAVNGAYYFNKLAHKIVVPVIAGQFIESYGNSLTGKTALVCISQSGETKDVINVVNYAKKKKMGHILSIVNVLGSTLINQSEVYLPLASELEVSVPATKTFMNQVAMLLYLAYRSARMQGTLNGYEGDHENSHEGNHKNGHEGGYKDGHEGDYENGHERDYEDAHKGDYEDAHKHDYENSHERDYINAHENDYNIKSIYTSIMELPNRIKQTIEETEQQCRDLSKGLSKHKDIYSLGYGVCHGTALEGALKIKEITYAHCEGMYSSEFKHGPLSIIEKGYPVIFSTVPDDADMIISHLNEVSCRNGRVIVVSADHESIRKNARDYITIPGQTNPFINSILNVIPLQLIAYYWSIEVGNNPDLPRNLSKTLTVD